MYIGKISLILKSRFKVDPAMGNGTRVGHSSENTTDQVSDVAMGLFIQQKNGLVQSLRFNIYSFIVNDCTHTCNNTCQDSIGVRAYAS